MKMQITHRGKTIILMIIVIIFLGSIYYSYSYVFAEEQVKEEKCLMTYKHTGTFEYFFTMDENTLYGESTLEKGKPCFTKVVDKLHMTYISKLEMPEGDVCCSNYNVYADIYCEFWDITEKLDVHIVSEEFDKVQFTINFREIVSFIDSVEEELEVQAGRYYVKIRVPMGININAYSHLVSEQYEDTYTFLIESNVISPDDEQSYECTAVGNINETEIVTVESSNMLKSGFVFINFFLLAGALLSYVYIRPNKVTLSEQMHLHAKKKFQDYMIEVTSQPPKFENATIPVTSIEELARIAEGMNKPVLHFKANGYHKYYIITESVVYMYIQRKEYGA